MLDSTLFKLLKSVFLPVDEESLVSVVSDIQQDAQKTSWIKLLHRIEAVAVLILIPGIVILGGVFINEFGSGLEYLKTIGIQYAIGGLLLLIVLVGKAVIWIVDKINKGQSVWGVSAESYQSVLTQFLISVAFLLMSIYIVYNIDASLDFLITLSVVMFVIMGCVIAGISGILTTVLLFKGTT